MILMDKTYDEIMEETLDELEGMGVTEKSAGGIARLFLSIINKRLASYYTSLKVNHMQAFLSKATGPSLDMIGELLDCKRTKEEINEDEKYRYRITKQIQIVASANRAAIRLAALGVAGVQDVHLKRFTHGTGSFSVYVISENPTTPQDILDEVQEAIDKQQAFGVRGEVFRPSIMPVQIKIRLIFNKIVTDLEKQLVIAQTKDALRKHMNSFAIGQELHIKDIELLIKKIYDEIEEVIMFDFRINNRPMLPVNQTCAWNERFIESDKPNAIQVL